MTWKVDLTLDAQADLKKLGFVEAQRVLKFLYERLCNVEHPRTIGEALKGHLRNYWKYRVGDYRIICRLEDNVAIVLVIHVGHRREVYKK